MSVRSDESDDDLAAYYKDQPSAAAAQHRMGLIGADPAALNDPMEGVPLSESLIDDHRWSDILTVRTINALINAYGKVDRSRYLRPLLPPTAAFVCAQKDDQLLLVKNFGRKGLEQVHAMRKRLSAAKVAAGFGTLTDALASREREKVARHFIHYSQRASGMKQLIIDEEGNVQALTDVPDAPKREPLTIEEYQRRAMVFLAADVHANRFDVNTKLNKPSAAMKLNAALGVASEAGEICEIYKKHFFHGHPMDAATVTHLKKETGDLFWYLALQCYANGWDPREILQLNIDKLTARYPEGFSAERSMNRAPGDV